MEREGVTVKDTVALRNDTLPTRSVPMAVFGGDVYSVDMPPRDCNPVNAPGIADRLTRSSGCRSSVAGTRPGKWGALLCTGGGTGVVAAGFAAWGSSDGLSVAVAPLPVSMGSGDGGGPDDDCGPAAKVEMLSASRPECTTHVLKNRFGGGGRSATQSRTM